MRTCKKLRGVVIKVRGFGGGFSKGWFYGGVRGLEGQKL